MTTLRPFSYFYGDDTTIGMGRLMLCGFHFIMAYFSCSPWESLKKKLKWIWLRRNQSTCCCCLQLLLRPAPPGWRHPSLLLLCYNYLESYGLPILVYFEDSNFAFLDTRECERNYVCASNCCHTRDLSLLLERININDPVGCANSAPFLSRKEGASMLGVLFVYHNI